MLVLSRRGNESVMVGDDVEIIVASIGTNQVRLGITAPIETPVHRKEICKTVKKAGRELQRCYRKSS